jgi:hypothetical protein
MTLFLAPETWPFAVVSLVILAIAVLEGLALLIGASASSWLDGFPHHAPHLSEPAADSWLGWLYLGRVPSLVLLVLFLALFTLVGFALDLAALALYGAMVRPLIAVPVAAIAALPMTRAAATGVARIIPRDQNFAVSLDSLVGRVAVIVSGTARVGFPAQGKVINEHGQALYVMVEPDAADVTFAERDTALLVMRVTGTRFRAIRNPRPDLL